MCKDYIFGLIEIIVRVVTVIEKSFLRSSPNVVQFCCLDSDLFIIRANKAFSDEILRWEHLEADAVLRIFLQTR